MNIQYLLGWKTCTVLSVGVAVGLASPTPRPACSKAALWGVRAPGEVYFLGVAGTDTVRAGAGNVTYRIDHGHFGRGTDRPVYGQVIDVEQLGVRSATQAIPAIGGTVRQVVLVPWDYAADCHPVPWSRSARWVPPATRGLFSGVLRDSAHWVNGIPTLDVHQPEAIPYPLAFQRDDGLLRRMYSRNRSDSALTADQLLGLYNVLPTSDDLERIGEGALAPLRQWMRDHATDAYRFPAATILHSALWDAEHRRVRAIRSPLAGTYRVVIVLANRDSLVLFARTALQPSSMLQSLTSSAREERARELESRAVGYYLAAQTALTVAELPRAVADFRTGTRESQGYVAVVEDPVVATPDSTVWQGSLDLVGNAAWLAPPALRDAMEEARAIMWDLLMTGQHTYAPGFFVRHTDGSVRYTLTVRRNARHVVTLRAERVSLDHLTDR